MSGLRQHLLKPLNLWLALFALAFVVAFLAGTGLIPAWGRWYAGDNLAWRHQTDALFMGSLAIADTPAVLGEDLVWHNGGVQQVWGLGIPLWRMPFEALAKLCGQGAFPDRLAFGVALMLIAFLAFKVLLGPPERAANQGLLDLLLNPVRLAIVALVLLFPPFFNTCRFHFSIYDEAVMYGYLYSIGLVLGTMAFVDKPTRTKYVVIAALAGLAGLVRPTLLACGLATMILLCYHSRKAAMRWPWLLAGLATFAFGGVVLFVTNFVRFGSGFEFGHRLNLNGFPVWMFTRFYCPFESEPVFSAARELFGSLFFVKHLNGFEHLQEHFFWGQSTTPRWRQFYMTTFDWSYLAVVLAGWLAVAGRKIIFARPLSMEKIPAVATAGCAWSILSAAMLTAFYLRSPVIASRYLLDFSGSFVAAMVCLILVIEQFLEGRFLRQKWLPQALLGVCLVWTCWQICSVRSLDLLLSRTITKNQLIKTLDRPPAKTSPPPGEYCVGTDLRAKCGIPYDGAGWDTSDGWMENVAAFFANDPKYLEMVMAKTSDGPKVDYSKIKAKIGLEFLEVESIRQSETNCVVRFNGPTQAVYQKGIQVVFLAYVDPSNIASPVSPLKLLRVQWRGN